MICDIFARGTQMEAVEQTSESASTITGLSSFITPFTFVGAVDQLGGSSPDPTEGSETTGTGSGAGSSPTEDSDEESVSNEEDNENASLRTSFDVVAFWIAGLIGAAGVI